MRVSVLPLRWVIRTRMARGETVDAMAETYATAAGISQRQGCRDIEAVLRFHSITEEVADRLCCFLETDVYLHELIAQPRGGQ